MHFTEAVAIATSSLWMHKLRSVLTLLGVVIGVTSVIAVVSLINGANQYVATRVFRLGADVFGLSKQPSIVTNVDDFLEFKSADASLTKITRRCGRCAHRAKKWVRRWAGASRSRAASIL